MASTEKMNTQSNNFLQSFESTFNTLEKESSELVICVENDEEKILSRVMIGLMIIKGLGLGLIHLKIV